MYLISLLACNDAQLFALENEMIEKTTWTIVVELTAISPWSFLINWQHFESNMKISLNFIMNVV